MNTRVNWELYRVRLVDNEGTLIVREEFSKVFDTERHLLMFIEKYRDDHQRLYSVELKEDPFYQQIPKEIVINDVIDYVAMYTGMKRKFILGKQKDRELADARKLISYICSDMGLLVSQIHKKTGFDRGGIYTQIKQAQRLLETDKAFRDKYNVIKDKINETNREGSD